MQIQTHLYLISTQDLQKTKKIPGLDTREPVHVFDSLVRLIIVRF